MLVFIIIVVLAVVIATIVEALRKAAERKEWEEGVEFNRDFSVVGLVYTCKMKADPEAKEFLVRFNPYDGHFYDKDNTGYHSTEVKIKKNITWDKQSKISSHQQ